MCTHREYFIGIQKFNEDEHNLIIFQTYVELDDEEPASSNILTTVLQTKEIAKKKADEKIQRYYNQQKTIYEKKTCAVFYNVGGSVHSMS